MSDKAMLTTIDNPFSPFTQFREWYEFDVANGYFTSSLLGRITNSSSELSENDQELHVQNAISEIIKENVSGKHRKVFERDYMSSPMTS